MENNLYKLPKELDDFISQNRLSQNRKIYLSEPFEKVNGMNISYDVFLVEGEEILGKYVCNSCDFNQEENSSFVVYSLYSNKPCSHVPREILSSFSDINEYLSKNKTESINHFAPIIAKPKSKIPGLIKILEDLGYEQINSKEHFYGKTYSP